MCVPGHWALSPAYGLNPVPEIDRAQTPKTAITEQQEAPTIAAAPAAAPRFGLKPKEAKAILAEVFAAVRDWRSVGRKFRLRAATLDVYTSAFEQLLMDEARKITGR